MKSSNLLPNLASVWNTALGIVITRNKKNDIGVFSPVMFHFFNYETLLNNLLLNVCLILQDRPWGEMSWIGLLIVWSTLSLYRDDMALFRAYLPDSSLAYMPKHMHIY